MKITLLLKIARQVEGEFVFVNVIRAHTSEDEIRLYLSKNDLPRTEKIQGLDCVLEYGVVADCILEGITSDSEAPE